MYKRFVAGVILLAGVIAAAGAQETIKMGYWDNAPFVIAQPGGAPPAGAAVDYWTAIVAPAMNVKVAWVGPTALPRLLIQLQSGEIDAVLVAARTPEREKLFQFAAAPSLHFLPGLAVLKENPLAAIKSADNVRHEGRLRNGADRDRFHEKRENHVGQHDHSHMDPGRLQEAHEQTHRCRVQPDNRRPPV